MRLKQQYDTYLTASGNEKNEDSTETAILLNFAGEEAQEVFNTFQFPEGDEKNWIVSLSSSNRIAAAERKLFSNDNISGR